MIRTTRSVLAAVVLVLGAGVALAQNLAPSPLLAIEQNRTTVVERIVRDWGAAVAGSNAGISIEQLRKLLQALRSDYLLAASLTGSVEGLRTVVANGLSSAAPAHAALAGSKALGDASADLSYTPLTPCRIADTRLAVGPLGANSTRDFKVWVSSGGFTAQGGDAGSCNVPPNPAAVVLNVTAVR